MKLADPTADDLAEILHYPSLAAALDNSQRDLLIQAGAAVLLEEQRAENLASHLEFIIKNNPSDALRNMMLSILARGCTTTPAFADILFSLAIRNGNLHAQQILVELNPMPANAGWRVLHDFWRALVEETFFDIRTLVEPLFDPGDADLRARLIHLASQTARYGQWALTLEEMESGKYAGFLTRLPQITEAERDFGRSLLARLAAEDHAARDGLGQMYFDHADEKAGEIIEQQGWIPDELTSRVLFLFLSGKKDELDQIDGDGQALAAAYEESNDTRKRRMLSFSRGTGQIAWLRHLAESSGSLRHIRDLSQNEWIEMVRTLQETGRQKDLWRLAQAAPPRWSVLCLNTLRLSGWQPESPSDVTIYSRLIMLAEQCRSYPDRISSHHDWAIPEVDLYTLVFHPQKDLLLASGRGQSIYAWELPRGDLVLPPLISPAAHNRALAITPSGSHIITAGADSRIRIFNGASGRMVKNIEAHKALVRSLQVDNTGRYVASAGFDGQLLIHRIPSGELVMQMMTETREVFCARFMKSTAQVVSAGSSPLLQIWNMQNGRLLRSFSAQAPGLLHLETIDQDGLILCAGRSGPVEVFHSGSGYRVMSCKTGNSPITAIHILDSYDKWCTTQQDGMLRIWNHTNPHPLAEIDLAQAPMLSAWDARSSQLAMLTNEGEIHLYNLSSWLSALTETSKINPMRTDRLSNRLQSEGISSTEHVWLELILELVKWNQRYDIDLSTSGTLHWNNYDIEL